MQGTTGLNFAFCCYTEHCNCNLKIKNKHIIAVTPQRQTDITSNTTGAADRQQTLLTPTLALRAVLWCLNTAARQHLCLTNDGIRELFQNMLADYDISKGFACVRRSKSRHMLDFVSLVKNIVEVAK